MIVGANLSFASQEQLVREIAQGTILHLKFQHFILEDEESNQPSIKRTGEEQSPSPPHDVRLDELNLSCPHAQWCWVLAGCRCQYKPGSHLLIPSHHITALTIVQTLFFLYTYIYTIFIVQFLLNYFECIMY